MSMKENGELCGHSNRVFCVKFDPVNQNMLASGGWDNTVQIYDIRKKGPITSIYGPHICGDAIDFKDDGNTMQTGSYRQDDVIELWDLRTFKKFRDIAWDGPKASEASDSNMIQENVPKAEEDKENQEPKTDEQGLPIETEGFSK